MRDIFPGYFRLRKTELEEIWQKGLFVPDANILLHLFRYGQATRDQLFETFQALKPRVWVPHRAAFEFSRRWRTVDAENRAAHYQLKTSIEKQGNIFAALFDGVSRHQTIDAKAEREKVETFVQSLFVELDASAKKHPSVEDAEAIADKISALLGDAVGSAPAPEAIAQQLKDGQTRYSNKTPPGYLDDSKSGDDRFGDYLIWEEIIAVARDRSMPIIFISDDRKEDWVLRQNGEAIGPRPELVQEIWERTGQKFHSYSLTQFLELSQKHTYVQVSEQAITEIAEYARQVEQEVTAREKDAEFDDRRRAWRERINRNIRRNREQLDKARDASRRTQDRIADIEDKLVSATSDKWRGIFSEWLDEAKQKEEAILQRIHRLEGWIEDDEARLESQSSDL